MKLLEIIVYVLFCLFVALPAIKALGVLAKLLWPASPGKEIITPSKGASKNLPAPRQKIQPLIAPQPLGATRGLPDEGIGIADRPIGDRGPRLPDYRKIGQVIKAWEDLDTPAIFRLAALKDANL